MSVYGPVYGPTYGAVFPDAPLDVAVELNLGGWTDITPYALQRDGTSPPITITRGRPDETSQATPSQCAMQWKNQDGRFSPRNPVGPYFGLLGRNTPLRVSVPDQTTYLRFADDAVSWASCPDSSALQLTGNIDARIDLDLDDYRTCTLAGKWGGSSPVQAWCLVLGDDGTVTWYWNDGTSVNSAQSTQPLPYLGRVMIRCFFDASAGQVVFYTAPDMGGSQTQLGDAVAVTAADYAQGAAGQPVQVGYANGFTGQGLPAGNSGLLGKVYEFALYNASAALVADPQFYGQTAGATSFADGQGNTWTPSGTAELSARSYRGHFECSSLPQQWDPTGADVWTPVMGSGVLRRLQQGNAPLQSVMRRGIILDIIPAFGGVSVYWPAEDPQGSTSIASGLPGGRPMSFTGAPSFQGQSGSPSADSVFACSAQLAQVGTSAWTGVIPPYTPSGGGAGLFFLLTIPSGGIGANCELLITGGPGGNYLVLEYATAAGGSLSLDISGAASITGPTGVNGQALWVEIVSATGATALNVMPAGGAETGYTSATALTSALSQVTVNWLAANLGSTEVGQIFFSTSPPSLTAYASLLNAYNGETAAARVARLCGEENIGCRIYGPPDLSATMGPQTIDTLVNLLQYAETSDRGMLYEPAECLGIGYRTLHSLCNQPAAVTLDYTAAVLGGDGSQGLVPLDDDQYTINDATVSRNNGSSVQIQVTTGPMSIQAPPDGVGDYATQVTTYVASDTQLPDIAGWITWTGTCDEERYPSVPFNLARPQLASLVYDIQGTRLGDYFQITDLPSWLPPGPANQLAYGVTEKLGGFWYLIAWNAVPEYPYETWVVEGTHSHLQTAGSTLHAAVSSAAATLQADTVTGSALWTTDPADWPFDILISGEQITVTAVSGSSSPQTLTVTRSVNGVVKAQAAGAAIALAAPAVLALA